MSNFKDMYVFELRKIFKRKIVWITLAIMLVISCYMGMGQALATYTYTDAGSGKKVEGSGYEVIQRNKANALTIQGKLIDDALLDEVRESYRGVYYEGDGSINGIEVVTVSAEIEGESVAEAEVRRMEQERLKSIYEYVCRITGDYNAIHDITAADLYKERMDYVQEKTKWQMLTEGEVQYWEVQEDCISKPFVYGYADGWDLIIEEIYSLNVLLLLIIAICLSTVFAEEHVRKTDQLILCSKYGKKTLYMAKVLAGVTFGLSCAVAMLVASIVPTLLIYGSEGFDVVLQIYAPMASWNITMGQAVLLMVVIYLVVAVFYSIFTMFLSEALGNSVAVMGIMFGGMIFTLVYAPYTNCRAFNQIYELLPTLIFGMWKFGELQLIKICGVYLKNLQIAPILYMMCSLFMFFGGKRIYKNYQVSGR